MIVAARNFWLTFKIVPHSTQALRLPIMFPLPPPPQKRANSQAQCQKHDRPLPRTPAYFLQFTDDARILSAEVQKNKALKKAGQGKDVQTAAAAEESNAQTASVEEPKRQSSQQPPSPGASLSHRLRYEAHLARQAGRSTSETHAERWQRRLGEQNEAIAELKGTPKTNGVKTVTFDNETQRIIVNGGDLTEEQRQWVERMIAMDNEIDQTDAKGIAVFNWDGDNLTEEKQREIEQMIEMDNDAEQIRAQRLRQGVTAFHHDGDKTDANGGGSKRSSDQSSDKADSKQDSEQIGTELKRCSKRQAEKAFAAAAQIDDSD